MDKKIIVILLLLAVVVAAGIFWIFFGGERYAVEYDSKGLYRGARSSYRAGQKVKLVFPYVATDTDYRFTLNGESVDYRYSDKKGFIITFTMPAEDVKLECITRNSMVAVE